MADDTATDDTLSIPEVSRRLRVSPRTIQRHEDALREVGSVKTGAGWRIPADQVETLAALVTKPRQTTRDTTPTPMSRRQTTDDTRQTTPTTHDACREREASLRATIERHEATIIELRARVDDLVATKDTLLEQQAQATASNAALALSLRDSIQRIETTSSEPSSSSAETSAGSHSTSTGLRKRFTRLFS